MKYIVILFLFFVNTLFAQQKELYTFEGTITSNETSEPLANVHIINVNLVKGTITNSEGVFTIAAQINDSLHISSIGYKSIIIRVTNDWLKFKNAKIQLTEKEYALEEIIVTPYNLTGYLQVDSKLIPEKQNYRYSISGLNYAYEAGEYNPNAFSKVLKSISNPADLLYNTFGKKGKEMKKLREIRKDNTIREALETKFDRETLAVLLNIDVQEIPQILEHCNYSEGFIKTANDLQIMDAINECYEQHKLLKQ